MIVSVTTHRTPQSSTWPARAASCSSITRVPQIGAYIRATPTTDASRPSSPIILSAGPFRAAPATMGDTATTDPRRAASAPSTPASERSGPIDTTGFDGAITTHSALSRSERSMKAAVSAPANSMRDTATACRMPTKYSWNDTTEPSAARCTSVDTLSSLMGTMRTPTPNARRTSSVTSDSVAPSASRAVR